MADTQVTVSIENLSPVNGTNLTPLWVGFHNGQFDTYDRGAPVTPGLESLAEDGDATALGQEFDGSGNGQLDGVVGGAPIAPGATVSETFVVDPDDGNAEYFSYASMILPSNDFFVANGNPEAHRVFDDLGNFIGSEFYILGSNVLDAGTEVNDEAADSTAFFGQSAANTGITEGVVRTATGFIPVAQGGQILADSRFANADFTANGYDVADISVTEGPNPGQVTVSITNNAPANGTSLTPLWVAFHNGQFDTYNRGEAVTTGLERLAEDGNAAVIGQEFTASGQGQVEGVVGDAPIAPGQTVSRTFDVNFAAGNADFFSYASMILPSNDFFVSNGDPEAHRIFENGAFAGADFAIAGSDVLDAGTEISDEIPANTAFFGQQNPNTGLTEGVVQAATGFIPNGRILSAAQFAAADFTAEGYQVAKVTVASDAAVASTFSTNFSDLAQAQVDPNDFQLGRARLTGGSSFFEGVQPLYFDNPNAWVARAGETLNINFDAAAASVSFHAIGLDGAVVEVFEGGDQPSQTIDVSGSDIKQTDLITLTGNISAIRLRNTSTQTGSAASVSAAALDTLSYTLAPSTFSTNFTDLANANTDPSDFQLGRARFTGGSSFFEGVQPLYFDNPNAWVARAGETLNIDFEAPASAVSFHAIGLDGATVEVFEGGNQPSRTIDVSGTDIKQTDLINLTGNITAIRLRNTSAQTGSAANVSAAALDTLSYTLAPPIPPAPPAPPVPPAVEPPAPPVQPPVVPPVAPPVAPPTSGPGAPTEVTVTIENLAPTNGTNLTPLWVGFHNGLFDTYDRGAPVTPGLESLAEDGSAALLGQEFDASTYGQLDGVVGAAPIAPGRASSQTFTLDPSQGNASYFSYASMILPSNDFFVSNGNPLAHRIFDEQGNFIGTDFFILGSQVLDAGTEVNDELPESTAFFGQSAPNTGTTENGVVTGATGFIPGGRILSAEQFAAADFTAEGYQVARVRVTAGPVAPTPTEVPTLVRPEANNLVSLRGNATALQFSFEQRNATAVNEIVAIATDNATGAIGGIAPGEPGYVEAAIAAAQTVFSALQGEEFADFNPTRTFAAESGQFLQFAVVQNGSLETLRNGSGGQLLLATPAGNADGNSAVGVESLTDDQLRLNFRTPNGGGSGQLGDLVVNANFVSNPAPLGTALQNSAGLEVLDLRTATAPVTASFELRREAGFDNLIGFYQIENEQGQVLGADGTTLVSPGEAGYQAAVLQRRLTDVNLRGENNQTITSGAQLAPGSLLAPFIIVDGTVEELLDADTGNNPEIFFAYLGANSDNTEHVRLLGDNTFGFEDLVGGGDMDFDDVVVRATLA